MTKQKDLKINSGKALTDNEFIAQFMGLPLTKEMPEFSTGNWKEVPFKNWKYHESWDWLLDVVEKIVSLDTSEFNYHVTNMTELRNWQERINQYSITTPMRIIYSEVVKFTKWYFETKERGS